jgi:hypothetical protein
VVDTSKGDQEITEPGIGGLSGAGDRGLEIGGLEIGRRETWTNGRGNEMREARNDERMDGVACKRLQMRKRDECRW